MKIKTPMKGGDGMPEIQVERGIPEIKRGNEKYPFESMHPGDSFFVQERFEQSLRVCASVRSKNGKRFVVRRVPGGVRCWRTV
jgi:hypothetical protein